MGDGMTERVKHWDAKWEGNCAVRTKNTMEKQSWWSMRPAPIRTIMIHMDKLIQDGVPYINDGTIRNETPRFEDVTPIWIVMKPSQCLFCATSATINLSHPPPYPSSCIHIAYITQIPRFRFRCQIWIFVWLFVVEKLCKSKKTPHLINSRNKSLRDTFLAETKCL